MEKFLALPSEKQKTILDAGFSCFGRMGYKKASAKDIAVAAGISKSMIFHYFGSKKGMYLYLAQAAYEEVINAFQGVRDLETADFFDRILAAARCKVTVLDKHPLLITFLSSLYFETDDEVLAEIKEFLKQSEVFRNEFTLSDIDMFKFKNSVKPELLLKLLVRYAEGYVSSMPLSGRVDIDALAAEFTECIFMLKDNFYKEEYRDERN